MTSPNDQKRLFLKTPELEVIGFFEDSLKREWCLYHVKKSPAIYISGYMLNWEVGYELSPDMQVATRMIVFDSADIENIKSVLDGSKVPQKQTEIKPEPVDLTGKVNFDVLINELDALSICIDDKTIEKSMGVYASAELEYAVGMVRHFAKDAMLRKAVNGGQDVE